MSIPTDMSEKFNNSRVGVKDPLELLPEELWEVILNKTERSLDIFNFLKAFPELDKLLHNQKPNWLFELVLPHIMTKYLVRKKEHETNYYWYLRSKELFDLRLVSTRWKNAVETCIQTHSDRHPTLPKLRNDNTIAQSITLIPEHHFSYQRMYKYHFGASVFLSTEQVDTFMTQMDGFHGNPFPGKFVFTSGLECDFEIMPQFVPKVVNMLHQFGEYVQILDLEIFHHYESNLDNFKEILNCLSYVPKLTSLTIRGYLYTGDEQEDDPITYNFFNRSECQQLFPSLPLLNTFDWQVISGENCSWANRLIDTYVKRNSSLRKLVIIEYYCKDRLMSNLSNLSELHLYLDSARMCEVSSIKNVLRQFPTGQLRKFCLSENQSFDINRKINLAELLEILSEFQIEVVILERIKLRYSPTEEDTNGSILNFSSITSLSLEDHAGLNCEFFKSLPNLRFLHVYVNRDIYEYYCVENPIEMKTFGNKLRTYFAQAKGDDEKHVKLNIPKEFSIWKELPKLEMLSASMDNGFEILDVQFFRECGNKPFYGYRPEKSNYKNLEF